MKLNLFEDIKGIDEKRQPPKVRLLKNNPQLKYEKEMLIDWTEGLVDRDNKFVREFQETFHSSFWEIFLYKLFIKAGFELDQSHQMPDFVIKSPQEVYVEAVTANIPSGGVPKSERSVEDQMSMIISPYLQEDFYQILNEGIIRSANAIRSKQKKFLDEYKNFMGSGTKYCNAINSLQLNRNISKSPESRNYSGFLPIFSISLAGTNLTIL